MLRNLANNLKTPLLPGLSKLQENREEFENIFIDTMSMLLFVSVPIAIGVACTSELLIEVLFGKQWLVAVDLLEILALYTVIRACLAGTVSAVIAVGKPEVGALLSVLRFVILVPLLVWGVWVAGPLGAALALLASGVFRLIANIVVMTKVIGIRVSRLCSAIWRTFVSTVIMAGIIYLVREYQTPAGEFPVLLLQLVILTGLGALVYGMCLFLLWTMCRFPEGPEQKAIAIVRAAVNRFGSWAKSSIA